MNWKICHFDGHNSFINQWSLLLMLITNSCHVFAFCFITSICAGNIILCNTCNNHQFWDFFLFINVLQSDTWFWQLNSLNRIRPNIREMIFWQCDQGTLYQVLELLFVLFLHHNELIVKIAVLAKLFSINIMIFLYPRIYSMVRWWAECTLSF